MTVDAVRSGSTPSSTVREWWRFFLAVLLAAGPVLTALGFLEIMAWHIGETVPMDAIARWQSDGPGREWRGGDGRSYLTYKVARIRLLKPDIIVLGQSRANSFSGGPFQPYTFYNSGLTAWTFKHYKRFVELITANGDYAPKVLIFNLDYWMFSTENDRYSLDRFFEAPATHWEDLKVVFDQMRETPEALLNRWPAAARYQGLYAYLSGDGFRADGSLFGQPQSPDPKRLLSDETAVGVPPVLLADRMAPEQVAAFEQFAAAAKARNIALIGVQVPFYTKILTSLDRNARAGIWREFRTDATRRYFESRGVLFFDFADMPEYRDKPDHFIDSLHPDARVAADVARRMLADPRVQALLPRAAEGAGSRSQGLLNPGPAPRRTKTAG